MNIAWLEWLKTVSILVGLIAIFWKVGRWQGGTDVKLDSINKQVNNHIPTQLKELDTKLTNKIGEVHERINQHDKDIGVLQGRVKV